MAFSQIHRLQLKIQHSLKTVFQRFEEFTVDVIYERRHGLCARLYTIVLQALSYLFSVIVKTRAYLYQKQIFRGEYLGCLVVVVGNLTVGGTGKTPIVEKFAKTLKEQGRTVAILSRGYKSKAEPLYKSFWRWLTHKQPPPPKIVSDGKKVFFNSQDAGDEPFMLARNLPGVIVAVDKNRIKAASYVIKHFGVDTILLDDGFQYLPLKSHLNVLLIDQTNPFGNCHLLPRGILREPVSHLKRASYVFITKSQTHPPQALVKTISKYNPTVEVIVCEHTPQYLVRLFEEEPNQPLSYLNNQHIAAFSGIASPESFEQLLRQEGAQLICNQRFLDHHRFLPGELEHFFEIAKESGAQAIITTEKDAVRLPYTLQPPLPLYYLKLEINIREGVKDFEEAVARICFHKTKSIIKNMS